MIEQQSRPNLYELRGSQLHVTFSTSGIDGKPHLTYQDAHISASFNGDDIRVLSTEIGTLVSVIPALRQGQRDFYTTVPLKGHARAVAF